MESEGPQWKSIRLGFDLKAFSKGLKPAKQPKQPLPQPHPEEPEYIEVETNESENEPDENPPPAPPPQPVKPSRPVKKAAQPTEKFVPREADIASPPEVDSGSDSEADEAVAPSAVPPQPVQVEAPQRRGFVLLKTVHAKEEAPVAGEPKEEEPKSWSKYIPFAVVALASLAMGVKNASGRVPVRSVSVSRR